MLSQFFVTIPTKQNVSDLWTRFSDDTPVKKPWVAKENIVGTCHNGVTFS